MIKRTFWLNKIQDLFKKHSIIWLYGVRRAGKTFLCKSVPDVLYFDCEIPEIRRRVEDESFLKTVSGKTLALDEIHRLKNPSELLKIAADHYPKTRIIATGSSTLETNRKFKDTLTGRKQNLHLTPAVSRDIMEFGVSLDDRLLRGGLPYFMSASGVSPKDYNEWVESYWARDVTGVFGVEKKDAYIMFVELLFQNSGGIFDATSYSVKCEVSRATIKHYLAILEETSVIQRIRPFSGANPREITAAPKIYAFDTGFAAFFKGWDRLRAEDYGIMWEHFTANEIAANLQARKIFYWRDKDGHEIDFVLYRDAKKPAAIEVKWQAAAFNGKNLAVFRKNHPNGENYLITHDTTEPYEKTYNGMNVRVCGIDAVGGITAGIWG
ncbi:MAG: ATP-binding protein [Oligoflexia bacterium]|nr:ATP-binding protein [Oligoflexia bacterium]